MQKQSILTTITALAFADSAFGPLALDPLRVPDPQVRSSSICGVTSLFGVRGPLFAPEGDGGGGGGGSDGGGEKKFTQADMDKVVGDRVGKMKTEIEGFKAQLSELGELKTKLAKAEEERETAAEDEKLKSKSELEKLQYQLNKAGEKQKLAESEWQKRVDEATALAKNAQSSHRDYVERHIVTSALNDAGIARGASKAAMLAFRSEAQLDLDENLEVKGVAVGGTSFAKIGEAATQFLKDNPYFAAPTGGGSGGNRNALGGGAGGTNVDQIQGLDGLLSAGFSQQRATSA